MRAKFGIGVLASILVAIGACSDHRPLPSAPENPSRTIGSKQRRYPLIAAASIETTFACRWDAWVSVDQDPSCQAASCDSADYTSVDSTCDFVQVGRWGGAACCGDCGRSFGAFDFSTAAIPDDAVLEVVEFRLPIADIYTRSQPTTPQGIVPCDADNALTWDGGQTKDLRAGLAYSPVDYIGQIEGDSVAHYVATECNRAEPEGGGEGGIAMGSSLSAGDTAVAVLGDDRYVNRIGITRFQMDSEEAETYTYRLYSFYSMRHSVNKPAELRVKYRPPFEYYGAALGSASWAGFDTVLAPDLEAIGSFQSLEESLAVYLVWQNIDGNGVEEMSTPIRLDQVGWWGDPGFAYDDFRITVSTTLDDEYCSCPDGEGPEVTLNSNGTLSVRDLNFGGIGTKTKIELRASHSDPDTSLVRVIVLQWDNPDSYYDVVAMDTVDAVPGSIVTQTELVTLVGSTAFEIWTPTLIAEWVSTDISGLPDSSLRVVDAADVAAVTAGFGNAISWGHGSQTPNFQLNCAPFGASANYIDLSDLSAVTYDLGDECSGASKPTVDSEREAILAWFGIEATGTLVSAGPGGSLTPGYAVADWAKARRAIADPYGYRRNP